ncbi:MAG: AAA family ATPase, partial [Bacteroidota bacterium]
YFQKNNVFAFLAGDNFDDEQMENLKNIDEYKQFEGKYNELKNKNDTPGNVYFSQIQKNGAHSLDPIEQTVKRYIFRRDAQRDNPELGNLISPFGENFFKVLITSRYLKENLKEYFGDYQLEIVYNSINNDLYIQKNLEGIVYPLPFVLVADTLQRILFYKAAIDSNSGSVLLFEEPEVNSFPPYVIDLANAIAMDEKNQFFISTHSPYLVINLLESAYDKAALFVMDYADHETNVIRIPPDQISKVLEHGYDFFLNMEEFTHE